MKQLNITFEDKEYIILLQAKETHMGNWHDFLLDIARKIIKEKKKKYDN